MNEGAAKAYRRHQRETAGVDYYIAADKSAHLVPGGAVKDLWSSLDHKSRGRWRRKFGLSRARHKRDLASVTFVRAGRDVFVRARGAVSYMDGI